MSFWRLKFSIKFCLFDHFLDSWAEICQIFWWFLGNSTTPKRHSEINWPLVTASVSSFFNLWWKKNLWNFDKICLNLGLFKSWLWLWYLLWIWIHFCFLRIISIFDFDSENTTAQRINRVLKKIRCFFCGLR